jgi:hypothetical protein
MAHAAQRSVDGLQEMVLCILDFNRGQRLSALSRAKVL